MALALAFRVAATHLPLTRSESTRADDVCHAVDEKGEPVDALGPADFVIARTAPPARWCACLARFDPMDIAFLSTQAASEGVLPRIREGLTSFIAKMAMGNQIAIVGLADRRRSSSTYTSNTKRLQDGIGLLWPRSQSGTTLLDAIYEVARGLEKRETPRAVIVPVITDGGDYANRQFKQVADEVKQAGASIHAITIGMFAPTDDDDLRNRARVLSETTRVRGAQRVTLLVPGAVQQALERWAVSSLPSTKSSMAGPTR